MINIKTYKWDLNFLKSKSFQLLLSLDNYDLTKLEKDEINLEIEKIDCMLNHFSVGNIFLKYPYIFTSKKELFKCISFVFDELLSDFQSKSILDASKYFFDYDVKAIDQNILNKRIPLQNQIDIIMKNFSFNQSLLEENRHLFNPNNNRIQIFQNKRINEFNTIDGKGYIANQNNECIEDFNALCHELGHDHEDFLTNERLNYNYFIKDNNHFFSYREIYSIFYELLSILFLKKDNVITKEEEINLYNNIFQCNTDNINNLLMAYIINREKNMSIRELFTFKMTKTTINDISLYYYSYLIAVNLFEQFLNDEEKALYNLNYFITNITPENEEKVLNYTDTNPNDLTKIKNHTTQFIKKRNN